MGGGMMRTATKIAAAGGFRAARAARVDNATGAGLRRSARPPASAVAVSGQAAEGGTILHTASSDRSALIDGWEVVAGEEEDLFEALNTSQPVRLVFESVPTFEEAREATSDLKDAVEKLYFPPDASVLEESSVASKTILPESNYLESMGTNTKCAAIVPSWHVAQAFSLLQECPEAQDVVASLASDKNIWDAVMRNEKVMEFYKTHQINTPAVEIIEYQESVVDDGECTDSSDGEKAPPSSNNGGFMEFLNSIKVKVTEVVNNLSDIFKDFMGKFETTATGAAGENSSHFNTGVGASFFLLAIAAILMVLMRRG